VTEVLLPIEATGIEGPVIAAAAVQDAVRERLISVSGHVTKPAADGRSSMPEIARGHEAEREAELQCPRRPFVRLCEGHLTSNLASRGHQWPLRPSVPTACPKS